MKYSLSEQSGFSLVETLVAITILLIVITGPLTISSTAARSTSFSSEQVVAFFLAQEGVEIAQKARDDLILQNLPNTVGWDDFSDDSASGVFSICFKSTGCGLSLSADAVGSLTTAYDCDNKKCNLYYDASNDRSRYNHESTGSIITPYTRTIYFEKVNLHEVKVTSKVTWRTGSQRAGQEVMVETYLFDINIYGN